MAITCPVDLDTIKLRQEIQSIYARVAQAPDGAFHFHRGPRYAAELLRYDEQALAAIPEGSSESFAGVANPHRIAPLRPGVTVIDIGCGAGMDLLLAARTVGAAGHAIGVDMTDAMADRARSGARAMGFDHVDIRLGDALDLPIESGTADAVMSNGVLNLTPDKRAAYGEVFRVLKPGGEFLYGDIVLGAELDESLRKDVDLWTGWIAGALPAAELPDVLKAIGFRQVEIREEFDCFRGTTKERTARKYGVIGVNVYARKPS